MMAVPTAEDNSTGDNTLLFIALSCGILYPPWVEEEDIFDHCRENNIDYVTRAIDGKKVDVNIRDEEGRNLLHWACDRGHAELVSALLQRNAKINSQDGEGQTALHYAAACEFADIVELLLQAGADPAIRDQEGCLPEEVTDCRSISTLLHQHTSARDRTEELPPTATQK